VRSQTAEALSEWAAAAAEPACAFATLVLQLSELLPAAEAQPTRAGAYFSLLLHALHLTPIHEGAGGEAAGGEGAGGLSVATTEAFFDAALGALLRALRTAEALTTALTTGEAGRKGAEAKGAVVGAAVLSAAVAAAAAPGAHDSAQAIAADAHGSAQDGAPADAFVLGLLSLLRALAARHVPLRSRVVPGVLALLIDVLLLPVAPPLMPRALAGTSPLCRAILRPSTQAEVGAYELLLALCEGGGGLAGAALEALLRVHGVEGGAADGWEMMWELETEPTTAPAGYVGLANLG
jgi:hypothetical protein